MPKKHCLKNNIFVNINLLHMGRNNAKNIKIHNDKLHKEQMKKKSKQTDRKEKLKEIINKFNQQNNPKGQ